MTLHEGHSTQPVKDTNKGQPVRLASNPVLKPEFTSPNTEGLKRQDDDKQPKCIRFWSENHRREGGVCNHGSSAMQGMHATEQTSSATGRQQKEHRSARATKAWALVSELSAPAAQGRAAYAPSPWEPWSWGLPRGQVWGREERGEGLSELPLGH